MPFWWISRRQPDGAELARRLTEEAQRPARAGDRSAHRAEARLAPGSRRRHSPLDQDVDALVEGSVTIVGDQVRVSVRLVDASSNRGLWARRYQGHRDELSTLEAQIARDIAAQVARAP